MRALASVSPFPHRAAGSPEASAVVSRSGFILKLARLREHWQGVVQRAEQRRSLVEALVQRWHAYRRSLKKLQRFLADTKLLLRPAGPARCSLQQLQPTLQDLQVGPGTRTFQDPPGGPGRSCFRLLTGDDVSSFSDL